MAPQREGLSCLSSSHIDHGQQRAAEGNRPEVSYHGAEGNGCESTNQEFGSLGIGWCFSQKPVLWGRVSKERVGKSPCLKRTFKGKLGS